MLAERTDEVGRQRFSFVNVAADLAAPALFAALRRFGPGFDMSVIIGVGHCRLGRERPAVGHLCEEELVRAEVGYALHLAGQVCGGVRGQVKQPVFAPRIFETMGMANPMVQTVLMGVVNILFTLLAVFTVEKWGRKPLLISGSVGMAIGAFGVAMCNVVTGLPAIISVISIMVYSASFMFSWGPICWVLIAEIFPNTIRGAAVAIAVAFQWIFNFIVSSTFLPMYNMRLGEMGDKFGHMFAYALYGIICVAAALFVWKLVPETKGKTLEDMTKLWKKKK